MRTTPHESKNWLEWTVFALGSVLVLAAVGTLVYEIWSERPRRGAELHVAWGEPQRQRAPFVLPVVVTNSGDEAAEHVSIRVTLEYAQGRREESSLYLPFVAQHGEQRGFVTFDSDPAAATRITARPEGYARP